jgi:uncharacterized membrane protein
VTKKINCLPFFGDWGDVEFAKSSGSFNATVRGLFYMASPTNWLIFEAAFLAVVLVALFFIARAASREDK